MPARRPFLFLLAAALLATALGCREKGPSPTVLASGHVEATDVRVATKIGGTLSSYSLEEGDRLTRGQEIARIDTVDLRLALEAARAERSAAQAQLALLRAGARKEDVAAAAADVDRAEAERDHAQRDLQRFQGLLDSGSGTEKTRDDARARRDVAAETLKAARERLAKLRAGARPEEIDAARARVTAADARIAQVAQQISDASVLSPVTGVVTEKLVEQGEILPPGTALAVVTDLTDAWLTAWVPEQALGRIRLGQEARVETDDGTVRTGRLTFIDSRAEFTPKNVQTRDERVKLVYRVKIALPNDDGFYKPGMPAEAHLDAVATADGKKEGGRT